MHTSIIRHVVHSDRAIYHLMCWRGSVDFAHLINEDVTTVSWAFPTDFGISFGFPFFSISVTVWFYGRFMQMSGKNFPFVVSASRFVFSFY